MTPRSLRPPPPDNAQAYEEMPWSFEQLRAMVAELRPELRQALARRAFTHVHRSDHIDRHVSVKAVLRYVNEAREDHEGSRTRGGAQVDSAAITARPVFELGRLPVVVARGKALRRITIARHGHPVAPPRPGIGMARGHHFGDLVDQTQKQAGIYDRIAFKRKSHDWFLRDFYVRGEHERVCLKGWQHA